MALVLGFLFRNTKVKNKIIGKEASNAPRYWKEKPCSYSSIPAKIVIPKAITGKVEMKIDFSRFIVFLADNVVEKFQCLNVMI